MEDPFEELPPICLLPQLRHVLAHLHAAIEDLVHDRKASALENLKSIEFDLMMNVDYDKYENIIERSSKWLNTSGPGLQEQEKQVGPSDPVQSDQPQSEVIPAIPDAGSNS